jgi:hypothetical protein
MSSTRTAPAGSELSVERGLSSPKIAGINIGLNIVIAISRSHPEPVRRSLIWLVNYSRNVVRCTADALAEKLDVPKASIRAALTDPECDDLPRVVTAIQKLRTEFESTITDLVDTAVAREVGLGMGYAIKRTKMVEIVGKTRIGKSDCARVHWLRNLDRCVWFECPEDDTERGFFYELAGALGIGVSSAKKTGLYRAQTKACFGPGGITCLIVDEAHRLWPSDVHAKPKRVEFLRSIYADGRGCSVVIISTPQHSESLNMSLDHAGRWAPGQYEGRVSRFHLEDTMSTKDLAAVARHHAGRGVSETVISALVEQALATEGYCGAMVETIDLARDIYGSLTIESVTQAQLRQSRRTRIEQPLRPVSTRSRRS